MRLNLNAFVAMSMSVIVADKTSSLSAEAANKKIRPVMVWTGGDSAVSKPFNVRCCSQKELQEIWHKHRRDDNVDEVSTCPKVDFKSYIVIAVFDGKFEFGSCFGIYEIVDDKDCIRIRINPKACQIGMVDTGEENGLREPVPPLKSTQSYAFIVLPASTKAVAIEEAQRRNAGDPYVWKEESRFSAITQKK